MMSDSDLTVAILRQMRDRLDSMDRQLGRLDTIDGRLEGLENHAAVANSKLDVLDARLGVFETTLTEFTSQVMFTSKFVRNMERRHGDQLSSLAERVDQLTKPPEPR
jgi:archaellum component FlaC